jgi:heat shock protein HslJ
MRIVSAAAAAFWLLVAVPAAAEAPAVYAELPGTSWVMLEWNGKAPKPARIPRLAFGSADTFSGRGGCNHFTGTYKVDGARIAMQTRGWTKMYCREDIRREMDDRIAADLRRVSRLVIGDDGSLVAYAADAAVIFRFRRARAGEKN